MRSLLFMKLTSSKPTEKKKDVVEEEEEVKIDSDNDGVFDDEDECPNTFGSKSANGCPDIDNDGIRDSKIFAQIPLEKLVITAVLYSAKKTVLYCQKR